MTLAVRNLSLNRGGVRVLSDVSAQLEPGEVTAIVGPNGAGKSSLLMALAGLIEPVAGTVSLDRRALQSIPPRERARAIGYLPQDSDVAWDVAVETLVTLGRLPHWEIKGGDRGSKEVDAAIHALALEPFRHRPVGSLSGGEKARALLARVLAGAPQWILADEPLAALDLAHRAALIGHLGQCAGGSADGGADSGADSGAGTGVVIVVHDLATAMNHADRVLVLNEGALVADAPPADALSEEIISQVWGVKAQWLGNPGRHALSVHGGE